MKLGSGIADVVGLRQASVTVGLGCDGAACANHFDGFEEMRLAAHLQKLKHGPDAFGGIDALRLATSEGAQAIGLGHAVGRIEVGYRADLVVLEPGRPELWGAEAADPHDLVAFSGSRGMVRDVVVGGEQLVADGRLVHLDLEEILAGATRVSHALVARSGLTL